MISAGELYWTELDIVDIGDGQTAAAIKHAMEPFCIKVNHYTVTLAEHAKKVFGKTKYAIASYMVIAAHGGENDGEMSLGSELAPHLAALQDFNISITPANLSEFINVKNKVVINTACTSGNKKLAEVFIKKGQAKAYIADVGYPYGYASAMFPILFFFFLTNYPGDTTRDAFERVKACDPSFGTWKYYSAESKTQ